jgi:aspartate carbamoyltransferase catalytic subunit
MLSIKNLITVDELTIEDINLIMETADSFYEVLEREFKKVPTLRGKTILTMFFEPSTRTRNSFDLAAKRLGADTINFSAESSSLKKGESVIDTIKTMQSMIADLLIIRHSDSGVMNFISGYIDIPIINAGDGKHQHPTQSLLDLYTIKRTFGYVEGLKVAMVGDIANSRVARSNSILFNKMGIRTVLVTSSILKPDNVEYFNSEIFSNVNEVLPVCDVIYMLRMQFERQERKFYPSIEEYNEFLGMDEKKFGLMKNSAIIMHPGPVNRGIEISEQLMNLQDNFTDRIKINEQVKNGLAVRMALIYLMCLKKQELKSDLNEN